MFDLNQRQEAVYELKRMTKKTPAIAAAFELIGGLFGVLGVGWIYAGDTARGVICLICYMVLWPVAVLIAQFSGGCLLPCVLPLVIGVPAVSSILVYRWADEVYW